MNSHYVMHYTISSLYTVKKHYLSCIWVLKVLCFTLHEFHFTLFILKNKNRVKWGLPVIQILSLDFCFCPSVLNKLWLLFFLCGLWGDFFPYFYNFTVIIYFFNFWRTFFVHETNFGLEYWGIFFHFSIQFWGRLFGC